MPSKDGGFDRLRLKNVRCFRAAEIIFDKRVTVIVGENASGKTTVIEALASLLGGDDEGITGFPLRHGAKHAEIALFERGRAVAKWDSAMPERRRLRSDRLVFLYGRYRRVLLPEEPQERKGWTDGQWLDDLASHAAQARTTTVTRADNRLLQDVSGYLRGLNLARSTDRRFEALWVKLNETLSKLDPKLTKIEMVEGPFHLIPKVNREGLLLELAQLSDGYQAMLVIVLDLMLRYAYLFFEIDPLKGRALVGIDEIDLHLHPRWQRTVLSSLTDLFPNTQFVVTTHSPIVVQAAIDEGFSVVRLAEMDGAVTAQWLSPKLMKALRGAEVGSVLFEDHLFGADSRFSVEFEAVEQRVGKLQAQIASGAATKQEYDEFKKSVGQLEELVVKEDRRRASGSTMGQMVTMESEFVKALSKELQRARHR